MLAVLLGAALAPGALLAAEPVCHDAWSRDRVAETRAKRSSLDALAPLRQALDATSTAADPDAITDALAEIAALRGTHPLVAAEIERSLLQRDVRRADIDAALLRRAALGFVTDVYLRAPAGDETALADALRALDEGDPSWRPVVAEANGLLPLDSIVYPSERNAALVAFWIEADARAEVALRIGADDRLTLDAGGVRVLERTGPHDIAFDQHTIGLALAPGVHRFVALVEQDVGSWGLVARLTARDGGPLPRTVRVVGAPDPRALAARSAPPPKLIAADDVVALLEKSSRGRDANRRAHLAMELRARSLPTRDDGRALELSREAVRERPSDPEIEWIAVGVERDAARRREALVRMLEFHPSHPFALRELSRYHLAFRRIDEAIGYARRAVEACPAGDPAMEAQLIIARDARGFAGGALAQVRRLAEKAPGQPALWRQVADLAVREEAPLTAREALLRVLAIDATDDRAREDLLSIVRASGDVATARRVIDEAIALSPNNPVARERKARFLLAAGDAGAALAAVEETLAVVPGRPELLVLRGEIEEALGQDERAIASFTAARDAVGGDESLAERIARATGDTTSTLGGEWRLGLDEARAIEARVPVEGEPAAIVLHETRAYRVQANGLGARFHQLIWRIREAEQAQFLRSFPITYSPRLQAAVVLEARVLRADGSVLLAGKQDRPLLPDPEIRMWYDARVLSLGFPRLEAGDLVEISYVVTDRGPTNQLGEGYFGDLHVFGEGLPVLSSRVVLDAPPERPLAHVLVNVPGEAAAREVPREGRAVRVIDLPALPAFQPGSFAPPATERLPYVVVGTIGSWEELGRLYAELMRQQTVVTPDVRDLVRSLTTGVRDRETIVRRLYDWVIESTRYVALEFGIHALKPYSVDSVFERRHGDCKDKATLLASMLREAGIEARIVLIRTNDRGEIDTTIPTLAHFNHAIVYVPEFELWLDGTVMHHAMGEVPQGDLDSLVLLVDPWSDRAGDLRRTPRAEPESALLREKQRLTYSANGRVLAEVAVEGGGEIAARERYFFRRTERPNRVLSNKLRQVWPDALVLDATFGEVGLDDPLVRYDYRAELPRFGLADGDRMAIPLAFGLPAVPIDQPAEGRTVPMALPMPFAHEIEAEIVVPDGWTIAEAPLPARVETPWLTMSLSFEPTRRGARVLLALRFTGGDVGVDRFAEFSAALQRARQMVDQKIVLRKEP